MPAAASSSSSAAASSARPSPRAPSTRMKAGGPGGGSLPTTHPGPGGYQSAPLSSRKAQALDMSTVERRSSTSKENPKRIRPHGLAEAPTYRPTLEQFKDPFEYIKSISEEGKKYGICKIIPPDSWNPDFAVDTEVCGIFLLQFCPSLIRLNTVFLFHARISANLFCSLTLRWIMLTLCH